MQWKWHVPYFIKYAMLDLLNKITSYHHCVSYDWCLTCASLFHSFQDFHFWCLLSFLDPVQCDKEQYTCCSNLSIIPNASAHGKWLNIFASLSASFSLLVLISGKKSTLEILTKGWTGNIVWMKVGKRFLFGLIFIFVSWPSFPEYHIYSWKSWPH